jgi:Na+/H+ antiporter NhaD/arsenite permease-like protein
MSRLQIVVLVIVGACYLGITLLRRRRVIVVWVAAALLIAIGGISPYAAWMVLDWNVLGMLIGTTILARRFTESGVTLVLARQIATRAPNARMAILSVCFATGFLSSWMDNVATVLIAAPVAFAIADHLEADAAPFLIALTLSANLHGAATLIGDATSMILASYSGMTFNDFFWFHGRPSLFFIVQVAGMAAVLVLQRVFSPFRHRKPAPYPPVFVASWVPTVLLLGTIAVLATAHFEHIRIRYLSAIVCLSAAALALVHYYVPMIRRGGLRGAGRDLWLNLRDFNWRTVALIGGLFVVVGALTTSGLTVLLAEEIRDVVGTNFGLAFVVVIVVSLLLSGVIDNIPYVTAMVPVVTAMGTSVGGGDPRDLYILLFGLLIGGTLGGNMVPVGSSTSILAVAMLERRGRRVTAGEFMRIGVPYTVVATVAAAAFIWVFWRLIP